jgi:Domain of unknown function (DUF4282)
LQREGGVMFDFRDLIRWDSFLTPSIIRTFFAMAVGFSVVLGLAGVLAGLNTMAINPFSGLIWIFASFVWVGFAVIGSRVICETILILFRINEHLGAIRGNREGL